MGNCGVSLKKGSAMIRAILCASCNGASSDRKLASLSDVRCAYNPALVYIEAIEGAIIVRARKCDDAKQNAWWRF